MIVYVLQRRPNFLRQLRYLPYTPFQGYYWHNTRFWINITGLKPEMGDSSLYVLHNYPGIRYTNMNHPSQITDPLETGVEEEHHNWNDAHFLEFPTVH